MKITEFLKDNFLFLDGAMGTQLQAAGLLPGELPERWNITHPDIVTKIHKEYFESGANVVSTNTFGANALKFSEGELREIIKAAIDNARRASLECHGTQPRFVALDIGPTGRMLKPYGDLDFEDAVEVFKKTVKLGTELGADLIFIETMNDTYEMKAATLAAKEASSLPVFVSAAYGEDGKLFTGASPLSVIALLEGLGADAIGVNCSLGPKALSEVVGEYLKYSSLPVILKPNAGLPRPDGSYDVSAEEFAREIFSLAERGVRILGGCCGTTPEYIEETVKSCRGLSPKPVEKKDFSVVTSYARAVTLGGEPRLIGERINPTGKKRFKEALLSRDMDYILREGIAEEERGVDILDVNVGMPGIDECEMLTRAVCELQAVTALPLQVDTSNTAAMESALRRYNGKAMINSVNGKAESMASVFPLAKKYGGVVVALTLDEGGIPKFAEERVKIAKKILAEAKKYGIDKKDIIFDPLTMAVSADKDAARETLRAVRLIKRELSANTVLGVSNVSFGLPNREAIGSVFFAEALFSGLDAAIMNPHSREMMRAYYSYLALSGLDESFSKYIGYAASEPILLEAKENTKKKADTESYTSSLSRAIIKGLKNEAESAVSELLLSRDALDIINSEIIPALNTVGEGFEKKTVYLPELLISAEAAGAAFEKIKSSVKTSAESDKPHVLLATVKGDIHDIGKKIVKLLLESYGFPVTDLGRDVPPEVIRDEAIRLNAPIVGLSALMTTTVPAMAETVKLLHRDTPNVKVMVGGAVLTPEYAESIGADGYAKDAMGAVRLAEKIYKKG